MNRGDAPGDPHEVSFPSLDELAVAYSRHIRQGTLVVAGPVRSNVTLQVILEGRPLGRPVRGRAISDPNGAEVTLKLLDGGELGRWVARCLTTAASSVPPAQEDVHAAKVLIVDDDDSHRAAVAMVLSNLGYELVTAKDGADALGKAVELKPDLVLTDVNMPLMDGWQLLRLIRARPTLRRTGVIFLTTLRSDEERLKGYRLGVDDYVEKPVQGEELVLRVEKVLRERAARISRRPPPAPTELHGDLEKVALSSVLGLLELEKRTGVLVVQRAEETASFHVRAGRVIRLALDPEPTALEPLERFFRVLEWTDGSFELTGAEVQGEDEIGLTTSYIVLEHARRKDERDAR